MISHLPKPRDDIIPPEPTNPDQYDDWPGFVAFGAIRGVTA